MADSSKALASSSVFPCLVPRPTKELRLGTRPDQLSPCLVLRLLPNQLAHVSDGLSIWRSMTENFLISVYLPAVEKQRL